MATSGTHRSIPRSRQRFLQLGTAVGVLMLVATAGAASAEEPLPLSEDPVLASVVSQLFVAGEAPILLATAYDYENPPSSKGDVESYSYNGGYIFGMTRGVARSTMVAPVKPLLFLLTIPLDLVLLPFAVIGGFFG